ncbi:IPT/TIG domain-containing protein [Chitinophaga nivalis]|uniref:IPT/TIG domain-containing protein n=1 Tax=Chitinophaga nivalis TaxID=2991709 RepID=A0ABT3IGN3_9BACT|nr:IPT/TIG domain-containing protein [Chitinophaga nivalis]MCW3467203.1 IPT/TIG domain-containing protein [Chitinophaga nivalis]MCW3483105.1 IPT/TIG domain-containing protein [Chitinophaga nivalis]
MMKTCYLPFLAILLTISACKKNAANLYDNSPIIDSISPLFVAEGETFNIYGKNFSPIAENNDIKINGIPVTGAVTGNSIRAKLPKGVFPDDTTLVAELILKVTGFQKQDTTYFYSNLTPRVYSMAPLTVHIGDTITITGKGFADPRDRKAIIFIPPGDQGFGIIGKVTFINNSLIKLVVPPKVVSGELVFFTPINRFIIGNNIGGRYPITVIP